MCLEYVNDHNLNSWYICQDDITLLSNVVEFTFKKQKSPQPNHCYHIVPNVRNNGWTCGMGSYGVQQQDPREALSPMTLLTTTSSPMSNALLGRNLETTAKTGWGQGGVLEAKICQASYIWLERVVIVCFKEPAHKYNTQPQFKQKASQILSLEENLSITTLRCDLAIATHARKMHK